MGGDGEAIWMRQPSGFVPIRFRIAGRILTGLGVAGLLILSIVALACGRSIAWPLPAASAIAVLVGLYLLFVVPKEGK